MPISYHEALQGSLFKFLLGDQQKPMTIHTALVAEQSPALRTLVSGFMREAQTGTTIWQDVDTDTFARFAEFVYTGDYPPPSCNKIEDPPPPAMENDDPAIEDAIAPPPAEPEQVPSHGSFGSSFTQWEIDDAAINEATESPPLELEQNTNLGFGSASDFATSKKEKRTKKEKKGKKGKTEKNTRRQVVERTSFHDLVYKVPHSSNFARVHKIRPNESSNEDYTPVFLGHARLYVFADEWNIKPLKALVLHKLHATLCQHTPYEARYSDIVKLIRYTYENTPCRKRMDKLRELVTLYVVHEQPQIAESEQCLALVQDGGPCARDLFVMVLEKLEKANL